MCIVCMERKQTWGQQRRTCCDEIGSHIRPKKTAELRNSSDSGCSTRCCSDQCCSRKSARLSNGRALSNSDSGRVHVAARIDAACRNRLGYQAEENSKALNNSDSGRVCVAAQIDVACRNQLSCQTEENIRALNNSDSGRVSRALNNSNSGRIRIAAQMLLLTYNIASSSAFGFLILSGHQISQLKKPNQMWESRWCIALCSCLYFLGRWVFSVTRCNMRTNIYTTELLTWFAAVFVRSLSQSFKPWTLSITWQTPLNIPQHHGERERERERETLHCEEHDFPQLTHCDNNTWSHVLVCQNTVCMHMRFGQ
jgi:hypothetical protein